jgi:hypothetical protein
VQILRRLHDITRPFALDAPQGCFGDAFGLLKQMADPITARNSLTHSNRICDLAANKGHAWQFKTKAVAFGLHQQTDGLALAH